MDIKELKSPAFNHLLIMFGGLQGLEAAVESDESLKVDEPQLLFDHYLNVLPNQGSRTIRTEEAILISLTALQGVLNHKNPPKQFTDVTKIATSDYDIPQIKCNNDEVTETVDLSRFD